MDRLIQDVRYGLRIILKNPGFAAVAVMSLALGIGANTAIFSLVDKVLIRKLPVEDPNRLVIVNGVIGNDTNSSFSYPLYKDFRDHNDVLAGLIAYDEVRASLSDSGSSELIRGQIVTGNYFSVLGVEPALGRFFLPDEDATPGAAPVVVLGYGIWKRRFAGDPQLMGKTITLNERSFTVIGVAPPEFTGARRAEAPEIYVPMMMQDEMMPTWRGALTSRFMTWLYVMGRLKPGVTGPQAAQALTAIAEQDMPMDANAKQRIILKDGSRGDDSMVAGISISLAILTAMVALVLLSACANVANLMLARVSARRKEMAIRLAVGASRLRLLRQLLTESLLLSAAGGALGLVLARWLYAGLLGFRPDGFDLESFRGGLDSRVLAFSAGLALFAGIITGIAPALQSSRPNMGPVLKDESKAIGVGSRSFSLRGVLVSLQVALSMLVLIGAGLCIRSLIKLNAIDPGFDPSRVVIMSLDLSLNGYDQSRGRQFYSELTQRVARLPGVESNSLAALVTLGGNGMRRTTEVEGYQNQPGEHLNFNFNVVSPGYFQTMKIPFSGGHDFTESDNSTAPGVVIVNEALVDRFWAGQNPLAKRLTFRGFAGDKPDRTMEVVGVVRNSRYRSLTEAIAPTMYLPLAQNYRPAVTLHVRTAVEPGSAVAVIADEVRSLDAGLPVYNVKTLEEQRASSLYDRRMTATLLGLFGLVALLLACIGIYGVMSYSVAQRSREIGIRMALGARRRNVMAMVLKQGIVMLLAGITVGVGSAVGLTRLMTSLLFGVAPSDPATFGFVALLLAAVALLACYLPARRAASADPMSALRCE